MTRKRVDSWKIFQMVGARLQRTLQWPSSTSPLLIACWDSTRRKLFASRFGSLIRDASFGAAFGGGWQQLRQNDSSSGKTFPRHP
jgi:hypothetical protein